MPSSGLKGPYSLTAPSINNVVAYRSPGAYVLGRNLPDSFEISYVGRSDTDVNGRLKNWVGGRYPYFKFDYFGSPKAAFEKECQLFHDFGETTLDNKVHPARPENSNWKCPRCRHFG